jgi:membrane protease YdiL (CAAX protease family)
VTELWISCLNAVLAAGAGTLFYVLRRSTGSILPAMVAHGLWDFTLFTAGDSPLPALRAVPVIGLFIAFWFTRDHVFGTETETGSTPAIS